MNPLSWIGFALEGLKEFFGWKKQKEINLPGQQKRDEVQEARKERDDNEQAIDDFMAGRKPKP